MSSKASPANRSLFLVPSRTPRWAIAAALVALLGAAAPAVLAAQAPGKAQAPGPALRRFAIIASANDGGAGRARLRFADSDAQTVADVLQSLGGLSKADLLMVPAATPTSLQTAFDRLKADVATAGGARQRRELFVYYSGHSDEEGLLLGGQRVPYRQLRTWIDEVGADVRIAILDSCASGALIRLRGGRVRPPFMTDLSTDARGHAFLTASSADEAAQESDRIGAGFFTHYLVSGLRGAADSTRDGRVTLHEAYQFAYQETLLRTERTAGGPQHPRYEIQLAGTGDLVMTDVGATGAALVLEENVVGRIYVRDGSGRLLVELRKEPHYPVELGLGPGRYQVSLDADGAPFEAQIVLTNGRRSRLGRAQFTAAARTVAVARGDGPAAVPGAAATVSSTGEYAGPYRFVPFDAVLAPGVRASGSDTTPVHNNFVLGVLGHSHVLEGVQLSIGGNMTEHRMEGAQVSSGFNLTRGSGRGAQVTGGANVALGPFLGAQVGGITNITTGDHRGAQVSQFNWIEGSLLGAQVGVINRTGAGVRGAQVGVVGVTGGRHEGAQVGVANAARSLEGGQIGVANVTGQGRGLQVGVLNVGEEMSGLQLSVVNVGRKVRGLQLGVVNIAESVDGAAIGLINIIGDGYHRLSLWSSDLLPTNIGIKLGSKHVYSLFGFGVGQQRGAERPLYGSSFGLGVHTGFLVDRLFMDVDAVGTQYHVPGNWGGSNQVMSTLRWTVGYQLFKHLAITAGPTYNVYVRRLDSPDHGPGTDFLRATDGEGNWQVSRFPGFLIGLQI